MDGIIKILKLKKSLGIRITSEYKIKQMKH